MERVDDDVLVADASNRQVPMWVVYMIAKGNMIDSMSKDEMAVIILNGNGTSDAELLQWATDYAGNFSDGVFEEYGFSGKEYTGGA